jgi:prophage regulatory protein
MQNLPPKLLTKVATCERLCVSDRTLEKLVRANRFPAPLRLGKQVLWAEQAVERWLEQELAEQLNWVRPRTRRRSTA